VKSTSTFAPDDFSAVISGARVVVPDSYGSLEMMSDAGT